MVVEFVGEVAEVLGDIVSSLVLAEVIVVEVPVESGTAFCLQTTEQGLFHLLEQVEADEDIGVVVELYILVGSHLTVEGSLIGQLLTGQPPVKGVVDVADMAPQTEEPLFEFTVVVIGEVAEEPSYDLLLFCAEVGNVVEFVDVAEVGKHLVSGGHVLVEVVEISK